MTAAEAYRKIVEFLGQAPKTGLITEYKHVFGMRVRPGERLCVRKDNGEVIWEDDLPDELSRLGVGREIPVTDLNEAGE